MALTEERDTVIGTGEELRAELDPAVMEDPTPTPPPAEPEEEPEPIGPPAEPEEEPEEEPEIIGAPR